MGLFGIFEPKTKADWDQEIIRLQTRLAEAKASIKGKKDAPGMRTVLNKKIEIERLKGEIANAKIKRKNAPK